MRRITKLTFLLALFTINHLQANATTRTAASCSTTDVQTAIGLSSAGDTVIIPGTSCTWTTGVTVTVGITIQGTGTPNNSPGIFIAGTSTTVITDNAGATPLFNVTIPVGQTFHLTTMTLQPAAVTGLTQPIQVVGTCNGSGCPNLRIDNIYFNGWSVSPSNIYNSWLILANDVFGVIDHNSVVQAIGGSGGCLANVSHSAYLGVGNFGDNSWAQPDTFGTASALYIENNTLLGGTNGMCVIDTDYSAGGVANIGGARVVIRYNHFTNVTIQTHGTETTGRARSIRQLENYNNTYTCNNTSSGCDTELLLRGGTLTSGNNTYTTGPGAWINSMVKLVQARTYSGYPSWGWCNGTGVYDQNDGVVYDSGTITGVSTVGGTLVVTDGTKAWTPSQWVGATGSAYSFVDTTLNSNGHPGYQISASTATTLTTVNYGQDSFNGPPTINIGDSYQILRSTVCFDQIGHGSGTLLSGSPATPTGWVAQALDPVYEFNDTISGGSTVSATLNSITKNVIANRDYYSQTSPFTGVAGTGSGLLAARPATCTTKVAYWATDQNILYQCSATDTWTTYYQPYTYPHPLDSPYGVIETVHVGDIFGGDQTINFGPAVVGDYFFVYGITVASLTGYSDSYGGLPWQIVYQDGTHLNMFVRLTSNVGAGSVTVNFTSGIVHNSDVIGAHFYGLGSVATFNSNTGVSGNPTVNVGVNTVSYGGSLANWIFGAVIIPTNGVNFTVSFINNGATPPACWTPAIQIPVVASGILYGTACTAISCTPTPHRELASYDFSLVESPLSEGGKFVGNNGICVPVVGKADSCNFPGSGDVVNTETTWPTNQYSELQFGQAYPVTGLAALHILSSDDFSTRYYVTMSGSIAGGELHAVVSGVDHTLATGIIDGGSTMACPTCRYKFSVEPNLITGNKLTLCYHGVFNAYPLPGTITYTYTDTTYNSSITSGKPGFGLGIGTGFGTFCTPSLANCVPVTRWDGGIAGDPCDEPPPPLCPTSTIVPMHSEIF